MHIREIHSPVGDIGYWIQKLSEARQEPNMPSRLFANRISGLVLKAFNNNLNDDTAEQCQLTYFYALETIEKNDNTTTLTALTRTDSTKKQKTEEIPKQNNMKLKYDKSK